MLENIGGNEGKGLDARIELMYTNKINKMWNTDFAVLVVDRNEVHEAKLIWRRCEHVTRQQRYWKPKQSAFETSE